MESNPLSAADAGQSQQCPLVVWEEDSQRRANIVTALRDLKSVSLEAPYSLHEIEFDGRARGAVVSLVLGGHTPSALALIGTLQRRCAFVICCIPALGETDLAGVCQLFLAGASQVLDASRHDFLVELRREVERSAERIVASETEEQLLLSTMTGVGFAGRSPAVLSLFRTLRGISSLTDLPVLISGETGTGKELVASAIHSLDLKRCRGPLVSINCAALPDQLSESELFGHQRGSFTGAERGRMGLFRSAHSGVLFLDEISELSGSSQSKLLRVLQTGRLRSVGADRETAIDVRVIAATNRSLQQMVQEGTFRQDLFHRLNVLSIHIPPLRERPSDVAPLIEHFIRKYRSLWDGKRHPEVASNFVRALEKAMLPGNARQLENIVRRALVAWDGDSPLSLRDLPAEIWRELSTTGEGSLHRSGPNPGSRPGGTSTLETQAVEYLQEHNWNFPEVVRHLESVLVRGALVAAGGNQSEAARRLGITPRSIYNKLHRVCRS